MLKRHLNTDCPSPNIIIIPTVTISGKEDHSLPPKKPKLAETSTPARPEQVNMKSDSVQVPSPPKLTSPKSEKNVLSDSSIKKEVHSEIPVKDTAAVSKCEPSVKKKPPETQVKELKTPQRSWASSYLKDIGLAYKKPIKINMSSIKNKQNEEYGESSKSKSTDDEDTSKEIKGENLDKFPMQSPGEMGILINKSTNKDTFKVIKNENKLPLPLPETEILKNTSSYNEVIGHHSNINPQPSFQPNQSQMLQFNQNAHFELDHPPLLQINENPHFELYHPEMLQINAIPPTFCANFHTHDSLYTQYPAPFTEYDYWSRSIFHRPPEEKSYLDEVDRFLRENSRRISQDRSHSQEYRTRTKTRTRSFSLKNRDVEYSEKQQKNNTNTIINDISRDSIKQPKESIKISYDPERDASRQPNISKSTEKCSNVPSSSKEISYDEKKQKQTENSRRLEFIAKYNKLVEEFTRRENEENSNIRSRLEYYRAEATDFLPKSTNKTYKKRERSDSSGSEFVLKKSYEDTKTKKQIKRKRSNRSSSCENGCGVVKYKIIKQEKNTKRDSCSDDSSSGSCSMPCCSREIKAGEKPNSSGRSKSSNSEKHGLRSPELAQKPQILKESCRGGSPSLSENHKSRRDLFNSPSSETNEASLLSQNQKIKDNRKQKSIRERSNSRSNSEICKRKSPKRQQKFKLSEESCRGGSPSKQHKSRRDRSSNRSEKSEAELRCLTQKIKDKVKQKARRETSNSSSDSETCAHKLLCTQRIRDKKKRKRSNNRSNSERSKSPNAHKYQENSDRRKKYKTSKSSDRKKIRKVIKDVMAKGKESKETCRKEKEEKDQRKRSDGQKTKSDYAAILSCKETSSIPDNKTKEPAAVKSVVRIKDRRKSHHDTYKTENFDLRSKLSRKGHSGCFSKICNRNNKTECRRENLLITVTNQDEDTEQLVVANEDETKEKILKTARDKLIQITRKHQDNSKIKKHKKLKLVINVVCESSQSSDPEDVSDMTCPNKERERKDESTIVKKVATESNLSNELSFLDDLDIDEIVDSLTCNKNESCPSKDTTDTPITVESSSSPEIVFDTYDLVSDDENSVSDASTVHLEELRETNDILDTYENNNKNPQSERIVNVVNKLESGDANIITSIKLEKNGSEQKAMSCEKDIKQEILHKENKYLTSLCTDECIKVNNTESVTNNTAANQTKCSQECYDHTSVVVVKKEPACNALDEGLKIMGNKSKELESSLEPKTKFVKEVDINNSNNTVIPVHEIKTELVEQDNYETRKIKHKENDSNLVLINAIMEKSGKVRYDKVKSSKNKETGRNIVSTEDVDESCDQDSQVTAVLVNKIKEETVDTGCTLCPNSFETDLPLIFPNEIKEEMINDVPKESKIKSKIKYVEKYNRKENTRHIGEYRKEAEKVKHNNFNNLLSDVCVSESVTNMSTQYNKICSCGKNVMTEKILKCLTTDINKVNVTSSINISDCVDLNKELNYVKEEPNSDTDNGDESTVAVLFTKGAPAPTVSGKGIDKARENKETKHDGDIQSNIIEVKINKDVCVNDFKQEPNPGTDYADESTVAVLLTTDAPVSTVSENATKEVTENKENQHNILVPSHIADVRSNKEESSNKILRSNATENQNESTYAIQSLETGKLKEVHDLQVLLKSVENLKSQTDSQHKLNENAEPTKEKNKMPVVIDSNPQKGNVNSASDSLKLQIKSGNSDKPNKVFLQHNKTVSKSDNKISEQQEKIKQTSNVAENDNLLEINSTRGSLKIQIENKEVCNKPNTDSSKHNNIMSNYDKKISKDQKQSKPTPNVVKNDNLQEKGTTSEMCKLEIESGNMKISDEPNKDSSQNNNIMFNSDKKISKDQKQPKPTPSIVKKENLQENDTAGERIKLQIGSSNKEVSDKPNKNSPQTINIVSNPDNKINKHQEHQKPTPNVVKKNNLEKNYTAAKSGTNTPIRAKSTHTESSKKSVELAEKPEAKMIAKLEERLTNYLKKPYTVESFLHMGKFSKIYKCCDSKGQNYVVKLLRGTKNRHGRGIAKENMMQALQKGIPEENLNFVRFFNGLEACGQWCFLMEYCPTNLSEVLEANKKSLDINTVQLLSRQLVTALNVLRQHSIVHADIKPQHILLNSEVNRLKLGGLDCAIYFIESNQQLLPSIGTVNYRAPETIIGYTTDYGIDVWAAALVMYEMMSRRQLFPGQYNNDILYKQMCTRGIIPSDMIRQSTFAWQHFRGSLFMRRTGPNPQDLVYLDEAQIYRNKILENTIKTTYYKEWGNRNIPKGQKRTETSMMHSFLQLLEQMLRVHPHNRITIKNICTHHFLNSQKTVYF